MISIAFYWFDDLDCEYIPSNLPIVQCCNHFNRIWFHLFKIQLQPWNCVAVECRNCNKIAQESVTAVSCRNQTKKATIPTKHRQKKQFFTMFKFWAKFIKRVKTNRAPCLRYAIRSRDFEAEKKFKRFQTNIETILSFFGINCQLSGGCLPLVATRKWTVAHSFIKISNIISRRFNRSLPFWWNPHFEWNFCTCN